MPRIDIDQATVLKLIGKALRAALNLNDRQVYETLSPDYLPRIPKGGDYFVAISPLDGAFHEGEQVPGNLTEEWGVAVTAYTRIKLDSTDHDEHLLRDASRGLLVLKGKILAALVGQDPATEEGDTFLRQLLFARSCRQPAVGELPETKTSIGLVTIEFGVNFDWAFG